MLIVRWMNSMKVLYRGKPYKVYGTHTKHTGRDLANVEGEAVASFLIYIDDRWLWVNVRDCTPYKKKKHKKKGCEQY